MTGPPRGDQIRVVQALRGIAALLVVSVHFGNPNGFESRYLGVASPLFGPLGRIGTVGVDLFFLISGFIMVVSTLRPDGKSLAPAEFLRRRCLRIYPPMWVIELAVLVVYLKAPELVNSHGTGPTDLLASFLLLPQLGSPLLLVTWTLVFEMYFYFVFTIGLFGRARFIVPVLVAWGIAIIILSRAHVDPKNAYAVFLSQPLAFDFLIGAGIGGLMHFPVSMRWAIVACSLGAIAFAWSAVPIITGTAGFPAGWYRIAFDVPVAAMMFGLITIERARSPYVPRALERVGNASYAMYLLHVPLLSLVGLAIRRLHPSGPLADLGIVLAMYALVIFTGIIYFERIERPLTVWLRHGVRRRGAQLG